MVNTTSLNVNKNQSNVAKSGIAVASLGGSIALTVWLRVQHPNPVPWGQEPSSNTMVIGAHKCTCQMVEWLNGIALHGKPITELRSVTCHIGSHSVTCHQTQVNAPRLNPSHADRYSIYLPPEG